MSDARDQIFPSPSGPSRLRRVVLEFESFRDFIQAFSPVVSEEGMFVGSSQLQGDPPALGEEIEFEVTLTDDFRLVHGRGEVVEIRSEAAGESEAGVAVKFVDLDEPSRRLISRLLTNYAKDGGKPFTLPGNAAVAATAAEAVEPEPLARSEADELFTPATEPEVESEPELLESIAPEALPEVDKAPEGLADAPQGLLDAAEGPVDDTEGLADAAETRAEELDVEGEDLFELAPLDDQGVLEQPEGLLGSIEDETAQVEEIETAVDEVAKEDAPELPLSLDEPAADEAGGQVISEDIAQIAEELSGVHHPPPVEMPSEEDQVSLAGAGRASGGQRSWRTPLLAVLAGVVVAVGAWYLAGDQIKDMIGLGDEPEMESGVAAAPDAGASGQNGQPAAGVDASEGAAAARSDDVQIEEMADAQARDAQEPPGEEARDRRQRRKAQRQNARAAQAAGQEEEGTAATPPIEATEPGAGQVSPSPAAAAPAPAPVTAAARTSPITQVERITWNVSGDETVVTIVLDGQVSEQSYEVVRIRQGAPREVIKLLGVSKSFSPNQLDVGSSHLQRLRTGLHGSGGGSELHVVADLTGADVAITLVKAQGRTLRVTFS